MGRHRGHAAGRERFLAHSAGLILALVLVGCSATSRITEFAECPQLEAPEGHVGGVVKHLGGVVIVRERPAGGESHMLPVFKTRWPAESDSFYVIAHLSSAVPEPTVQRFAISRRADAIATHARELNWEWWMEYESEGGVITKYEDGTRPKFHVIDGWLILRSDISDCDVLGTSDKRW